jgi:hypothetical protein
MEAGGEFMNRVKVDLNPLYADIAKLSAGLEEFQAANFYMRLSDEAQRAAVREFCSTVFPIAGQAAKTSLTEMPARRILMAMKHLILQLPKGTATELHHLKTQLAEALEFSLIPLQGALP